MADVDYFSDNWRGKFTPEKKIPFSLSWMGLRIVNYTAYMSIRPGYPVPTIRYRIPGGFSSGLVEATVTNGEYSVARIQPNDGELTQIVSNFRNPKKLLQKTLGDGSIGEIVSYRCSFDLKMRLEIDIEVVLPIIGKVGRRAKVTLPVGRQGYYIEAARRVDIGSHAHMATSDGIYKEGDNAFLMLDNYGDAGPLQEVEILVENEWHTTDHLDEVPRGDIIVSGGGWISSG